MSTQPAAPPVREHERSAAFAFLGEFAYVIDVFVLVMIGAVWLIGGLAPFDSPVMSVVTVVCIVGVIVHQVWYRNHRVEIQHDARHRRDRERRGF